MNRSIPLILILCATGCGLAPSNAPGLAGTSPRAAVAAAAPRDTYPAFPRQRQAPSAAPRRAAAPTVNRLVRPGLIGIINFADGGGTPGWKTARNPNGWAPVLAGDLDLRDPANWPAFQANATALYRDCLNRCDRLGCEGFVWWDIEGGGSPDATYVGDPLRLPPELPRSLVAQWCEEARARGFKYGFCFRDTNAVGGPFGGAYQAPGDPEQVLTTKLQMCRYLYGPATLAYLDTLCEPWTWADGKIHYRPAAMLKRIQSNLRDWTLLVEFGTPLYDAVPRTYGLRWQKVADDAAGKAGDLQPPVCKHEILVPFAGVPTAPQVEAYRKAVQQDGALTFVCVTWDRGDGWVAPLVKPQGPATQPTGRE